MVSPIPAPVVGVTGVRELAFGGIHALALTEVGHSNTIPTQIAGLANVQSIAATASRSFAVLPNGTVMTWGAVPLWAHVQGDPGVSRIQIPLTLKGLCNP